MYVGCTLFSILLTVDRISLFIALSDLIRSVLTNVYIFISQGASYSHAPFE